MWEVLVLGLYVCPYPSQTHPDTHCTGAGVIPWCVLPLIQCLHFVRGSLLTSLNVLTSTGSHPTLYCQSHREESLKFHCADCDVLTCCSCLSVDHSNHRCGEMVYTVCIKVQQIVLESSWKTSEIVVLQLLTEINQITYRTGWIFPNYKRGRLFKSKWKPFFSALET